MDKSKNVKIIKLIALLSIVFLICVSGCEVDKGKPPGQSNEIVQTDDFSDFPDIIGISTGAVGTGGHSSAVAYATIMEQYFDRPVRVLPANTTPICVSHILQNRTLFVGGGQCQNVVGDLLEAKEIFASPEWGPQEVAIMWYNYSGPFGLMTRGDLGVSTIAELKGKTVAVFYGMPAWNIGLEATLAFGGLSMEDVKVFDVGGYPQCGKAVAEGRADFTFFTPISSVVWEIAEGPHGIDWLPMPLDDEEGWAKYSALYPLNAGVINTFGHESAHGVPLANHAYPLWTHANVSTDVVYNIVKFFAENYDKYKDVHPLVEEMDLASFVEFKEVCGTPLHEGTVKYLREIGEWDEQDEQWHQEQWELVKKFKYAWSDALEEAAEKEIPVDPENKEWIELWNKHREKTGRFVRRIK